MSYVDLKYKPDENCLICDFRVEPVMGIPVKRVAEDVATESSVGTWTDVVTMKAGIKRLAAKVFEIKGNSVKISYPVDLFEPRNMPQILSSVAGNIFGMKSVKNLRLEDVHFPKELVRSFNGPLHGIHGVRKLIKAKDRPLTGTIIKPKVGLNEVEHAKVAYDAWVGGIDIVKDDENLSNLSFNRFEKRVVETLKMRDRAEKETGEKKMYMPNVTAETREMLRRAEFVERDGGEYIMVDIITTGWAGLQTLKELSDDLKLVIHAHRAGHATFTHGVHGVSMLAVAKIARMIGVDQLHTGTIIGKMKTEDTMIINSFLRSDFYGLKTVFPVASGGLHPGMIPELMKLMGNDIILQFGGGCHGHPDGTTAGAKAIRQALCAVEKTISLEECGKEHKELKAALEKWKV